MAIDMNPWEDLNKAHSMESPFSKRPIEKEDPVFKNIRKRRIVITIFKTFFKLLLLTIAIYIASIVFLIDENLSFVSSLKLSIIVNILEIWYTKYKSRRRRKLYGTFK